MTVGWWAERFADFSVDATPSIVFVGAPRATLALSAAPAIDMAAAGTSTAEFSLSAAASVGFVGQRLQGSLTLSAAPGLAMAAAGTSTATLQLAITPAIGMVGSERYGGTLTLGVTPTIGMTAYIKQLPHPIPWTL